MKKIITLFSVAALCVSCDEGYIEDNDSGLVSEGYSVTFDGRIWGSADYDNMRDYTLVLAGYGPVSEYAVITKSIPAPDANNHVQLTMAGISRDVTTIEVGLVGRLRNRIATFASYSVNGNTADVQLTADSIDASMLGAVQTVLFTPTCSNCHGGGASAAAGVYLTAGKVNVVGRESRNVSGSMLVSKGSAGQSVLYQMLCTDLTEQWRYNHSKEVTSDDVMTLVENWINHAAE